MEVIHKKSIIRGCGKRVEGGLYACVGQSPYGKPVEDFLFDPPKEWLNGPFRAPIIHSDKGINHIIMYVGEENYPYLSDFIEETKMYGISKRIPINFDVKQITPFESRLLIVHPKAIAENFRTPVHKCPKDIELHKNGEKFCINSLYYLIDGLPSDPPYLRTIGSTAYRVEKKFERKDVIYKAGVFASFPLSHFEYVLPGNGAIDENVKDGVNGGNIVVVKEDNGYK